MSRSNVAVFLIVFALSHQFVNAADRVVLQSTPVGARIYLNGENTKKETPANMPLQKGDLVEYRLPGYKVHQIKYSTEQDKLQVELQKSETLKMTIATRTGDHDWAGTNGVTLAVYLNGDAKLRGKLDNPGTDDFEVGGIDIFEFNFDFSILELQGIRLIMEKGGDAWLCDSVQLQFQTENGTFQSDPIVVPVKVWLSANLKEANRRKHVDIPLKKLKLRDTGER